MDDPAAASTVLAGAKSGAAEAAFQLLDVVFLWIVPIITVIVGYLVSATIGLSGALGTLIDGVLGNFNISATTICSAGRRIFAGILVRSITKNGF